MSFFSKHFNTFFRELAANNHKDWFDANRKTYEKEIKKPFKDFVELVIRELAKKDPSFKDVEAKDCIFRINRDIRFSKDKTPYKLHASALVSPTGKKDYVGKGIYFEFGPEHARFYGGVYEANKEQLLDIRKNIAAEPKKFETLYTSTEFKKIFGEIRGEKNKVLPAELKEAAGKEPLIFNKQFYFFQQFDAKIVESDKLLDHLLHAFDVAQPITHFLTH